MNEFNYLGNYHTHTQWCNHGTLSMHTAIDEALGAGMNMLGFSEHAPFPDDRFFRMKYTSFESYIKDAEALKTEYSDRLIIKKGLEIEFFPDAISYYSELLNKLGIDYLILGQHFFKSGDRILKTKQIDDTRSLVNYAESLAEAMNTGLFRIAAHPDYCFSCDLPLDNNSYRAMEIIINAAVRTGTILEVNANGFRKPEFESCIGIRKKYPFLPFWELAAVHNVRCIIGSDAHHPGQLFDDSVKKAFTFANGLNLSLVSNNLIECGEY